MAKKNTYVDQDFNQQEIQNFSIEKLAAHPTGGDLFEGRAWQLTTDDHVYHYSGGQVRQIANIDDLNKFGSLIPGGHDASGGLIPTQGSGVDDLGAADLSIEAGDTWRITVAGTIVGLASGSDELDAGDVLIALVDTAATASDFMAIQLNLEDAILDEVINYANEAAFPGTGSLGVIYLADDVNEAFLWDGAAYTPISLPNIQHEATLGSFPGTGDMDILYIADDSQLVYFWDGVAYIPLSGVFSNFYAVDGALTGNRTVSGGSNNLTFTGILAYTISTATYDLVTAGDADEIIGGNKTVSVVGASSETSAGKTNTSTGAGNSIVNVTDPDGAWIAPSDANPDGNVTVGIAGMVKYDTTDDHFRFYEGGAWRTFGSEVNIQHVTDFASLPVSGDPDIFYVTDDTDIVYFWDGAAYQLVGGGSLYTNDGSLTGSRTVTMGSNSLTFDQSASNFSFVNFSDTTGLITINSGVVTSTFTASGDSMVLDGDSGVYRQGGSVGEGQTILSFPVPATPSTNFTLLLPTDVNGTVALLSDIPAAANTLYSADDSITGNRTVTGNENLIQFVNTNFKAESGDGAYIEINADEVNMYGGAGVAIYSLVQLTRASVASQSLYFNDNVNANAGVLTNAPLLTVARTWTLQDGDGTLAFLTDIPAATGDGIYDGSGSLTVNTTVSGAFDLEFTNSGTFKRTGGASNGDIAIDVYAGAIQAFTVTKTTADANIAITNGQSNISLNSNQIFVTTDNLGFAEGWIDMGTTSTKIGFGSGSTAYLDFTATGTAVTGPATFNSSFRLANLTTTPAAGYVLQSTDALGNADWVIASGDGIYDGSGTVAIATDVTLGAALVFNNTRQPHAISFHGDTLFNVLVIDAATDSVGIGTAGPSGKLHVQSSGATTGSKKAILVSASNSGTAENAGVDIDVSGSTSGTNWGVKVLARNSSTRNVGQASYTWGTTTTPSLADIATYGHTSNSASTSATSTYASYFENVQTNTANKYGQNIILSGDQASGTGYGVKVDFDTTFTSGTGYGIDVDFGGTTPTKYGARVVMNEGGTTHYGVYLDISGATTNYGFLTNAPLNGLGTFAPDALLEITGGQMYVAQTTDTVGTTTATIDWDEGNHTVLDMEPSTGTVTLTLSNPKAGAWYAIKVIQGSGGNNITWPGTVFWEGAIGAPVISATDNFIDLIRLYYDGTNYLGSYIQGFA